ncbi:MAG: lamin tail domain-containing protein, partial [Anaerolineales bacterium]|nr:lamin tail domain-containing protein [Anaerolineales bacterium]
MQDENSIYFPFLNYLDPVAEELKNHLVISEVMFNPTGAEPGNEWIEIFNRSPLRVDLHEYKIGDSETPGDLEGMYAFPEGSHVSPGKTVVIANQAAPFIGTYGFRPDFELVDSDPNVQNMMKYRNWAGGVINLNNSGDEITIINKEDKQVDAVSWGDSQFAFDPPAPITDDGMTLERIPANTDSNRASDWSISAEPDPGTVNVITNTPVPISPTDTQPYCDNIPVLISEVLYDPAVSGEPEGEWVEIYNYGDIRVSLDCLILGDEETGGGSEGMMAFPAGGSINPGQVIVIANHADDFNNNYGFFPDFEIQQANESVPNLSPFPQWASGSISLSNSGDEVLLINLSGIQIDAVS